MLARDRIAEAAEALARGELPEPAARLHLVAALDRLAHGASWSEAAGLSGWLARAERDHALRRAAELLGPAEPWTLAGRLHAALVRVSTRGGWSLPAELREHLADALRAGGGRVLKRDSLYRLLLRGLDSAPDENPAEGGETGP